MSVYLRFFTGKFLKAHSGNLLQRSGNQKLKMSKLLITFYIYSTDKINFLSQNILIVNARNGKKLRKSEY